MPAKDGVNHEFFPFKLHQMLEYTHNEGNEHIVSWTSNGKAFRVHQRDVFASQILPRFFNGIKLRSFLRQLNLYCFRRDPCKSSPTYGAYSHILFIRGDRALCANLKRAPSSKTELGNGQNDQHRRLMSVSVDNISSCSWTAIQESVLRSHNQGVPLDECLKSNDLFQPFPFDGGHKFQSQVRIPDSDWRYLSEIVQELVLLE